MNVYWRTVNDVLVARVCFNGKHEDMRAHLLALSESVGSRACGDPFVLYRGGGDMEVCIPVTEPSDDSVEGGLMMCAPFEGDMSSADTGEALGRAFGDLWRHTVEQHIGVTEEPWREVLLEYDRDGNEGSGPHVYRAELQVPMLLPKWLARLRDGLDRYAGISVRQHVLGGSDGLSSSSDPSEKVAWMKGAMARLDAAVKDEDVRRRVMCGCAHVYPAAHIAKLRRDYERLGSVDALLEDIARDPGYTGAPYYRDPARPGNVVFIDKVPQEREKHESTTDPVTRRAAACHCPVIKAAILAGEKISPTFCECGTGWFKPLWEAIVEAPVEVICEESVLQGHDRCKFAIYLPEENDA